MFIVTNRRVDETKQGLEQLGDHPSEEGPNELRIVEATRRGRGWQIQILPDTVTLEMKREVGLPQGHNFFASAYAAKKVFDRATEGKRNVVFFVHGYNNNVGAVLDRADAFQKAFGVEVLTLSWPANGGGVRGVLDYKKDKRDARASVGALDRCLLKIHSFLDELNRKQLARIEEQARDEHPQDHERQHEYIAKHACPFRVSLVLHSMGNYLYKQFLSSSVYCNDLLIFDNVVLVAADVNNEAHADWVDKIQARNRVYISINEDDQALKASRLKSGAEQLARLGHYLYNLYSRHAYYVDFTGAPKIGDSHAYFEGQPLHNAAVKRFFTRAFNGERAEEGLAYDEAKGVYRIPGRGK